VRLKAHSKHCTYIACREPIETFDERTKGQKRAPFGAHSTRLAASPPSTLHQSFLAEAAKGCLPLHCCNTCGAIHATGRGDRL
jgi:hypothetical protein